MFKKIVVPTSTSINRLNAYHGWQASYLYRYIHLAGLLHNGSYSISLDECENVSN